MLKTVVAPIGIQGDELSGKRSVLTDPFTGKPPPPPPKPPFAPAALAALGISLFPLGSLAAIFVGLVGLRQTRSGTMRGRGFAVAAIALGGVLTVGYAVGGTIGVMTYLDDSRAHARAEQDRWDKKQREREDEARAAEAAEEAKRKANPPTPLLLPKPPTDAAGDVPQETRVTEVGQIPVVDIGVKETSLRQALVREMGKARSDNREVVVVTLRNDGCKPCKGFNDSLSDPLMQEALARSRVVRVDVSVFAQDLAALHIDTAGIPGFFLLRSDATPRDGIDGGEWGDDIAANIAPVLNPFTRGLYKKRKKEFRPPPVSGTFL